MSWNSAHIKISGLFLFWNYLFLFSDIWKSEITPRISLLILKLYVKKKKITDLEELKSTPMFGKTMDGFGI